MPLWLAALRTVPVPLGVSVISVVPARAGVGGVRAALLPCGMARPWPPAGRPGVRYRRAAAPLVPPCVCRAAVPLWGVLDRAGVGGCSPGAVSLRPAPAGGEGNKKGPAPARLVLSITYTASPMQL